MCREVIVAVPKTTLASTKVDFQIKDDFAPRTKDKVMSLVFRPKTKMCLWSWGKVRSSSEYLTTDFFIISEARRASTPRNVDRLFSPELSMIIYGNLESPND